MTSDAPRPSVRATRTWWSPRPAAPSGVAPGVDPEWADAFVVELRLTDVPGDLIGGALAEVASHCAESGEAPDDAFGDPVEYARSLRLPPRPEAASSSLGSAVPWVVQTVGLLLASAAAPSLAGGEPFGVTTGHVAAAVGLAASLVALQRWGAAMLRLVVRRPVVAWALAMAHFALLVAVLVLLDGVVVRVPAGAAMTLGAVGILAGTAWVLTVLRRDLPADDPVTAPLAPAGPGGSLGGVALRYGPALISPVVGLGLVGTGLLLGT